MKRIRISEVFLLVLFVSLLFSCSKPDEQKKSAVNAAFARKSNQEIALYVRKIFNVPLDVSITVTDQQSKIPGMQAILIQFRGQRGSQDQMAWIGPNQELIVGKVFDMGLDPYEENLKKVNLANAPVTGNSEAKVTIVEYSDFQCPFCSRAHVVVNELLKQYPGKIKLAYKHLPLNIHDWAQDAAVASVCVQQQNQEAFWRLSDYLFTNQKTITKDKLTSDVIEFAKTSNLNTDQLQKCITERSTFPAVQADIAEAGSLGFGSTPSFLVNGRSVVGAIPLDQFKQVIDEAIASAK